MVRAAALALVVVASSAGAAPTSEYGAFDCVFTEKFACQGGQSCSPVDPARITAKLDIRYGDYSRCEGESCDRIYASTSPSGAYLNINPKLGGGWFAKIDDSLRITEVVSLMDLVVISRGKCEAVPSPIRIQVAPSK